MASNMKFEDNRIQVIDALEVSTEAALYKMASEILSQTQRDTPVDTGQLKGSWSYKIDESKGEATIGSPLENAIWNEYGTGEHALNGDGRKGGWYVPEDKLSSKAKSRMKRVEIKGKVYYFTRGKKPNRTLFKAFSKAKPQAQSAAEDEFRQGMK